MKSKLFYVILILSLVLGLIVGVQPANRVQAAGPTCYVDDTAGGANTGTSWTDAFTDLQSALSDIGCTRIEVAAGIYYPTSDIDRTSSFQLRSGVEIYGGYSGGIRPPNPLLNATTLSGNLIPGPGTVAPGVIYNSYHVVTGNNVDGSAVLDGFNIVDGNADDLQPFDRGAGIYINNGSPTLQNLIIQGNSSAAGGNGMYLLNSSPTLTDVTFRFNQTTSGSGGGLWSEGNSNPVLSRVLFDGNAAFDGGGMYNNGNPSLYNVSFSRNQATASGGGLYNASGNPRIANSLFDNNFSLGDVGGGGLYNTVGNPTILDSIFDSNNAANDGGGLLVSSGSATLRNNQFTSNLANGEGGGLFVSGTVTMIDNILNKNHAGGDGGGLAISAVGSSSTFINLTVINNSVNLTTGYGGGIYASGLNHSFTNLLLAWNSAAYGGGLANVNSSEPEIANATIYANQAAVEGSAFYTYRGGAHLTNGILWGNPGTDIVDSTFLSNSFINTSILEDGCNVTCANLITGDPLFSDPINGDFHLSAVSPAVEAGDVTALPADALDLDGDTNTNESIPFDLGGNRRVVVNRVDLGAYEAQAWNTNWTEAVRLPLADPLPGAQYTEVDRYVDDEGQSRWFKFKVEPSSKVIVTLTGLSANYDLTLYKDIAAAYNELESSQDLVQLNAEFAPDTFSPDTFSPDTFSPDTFSPDTFSPDTFSPDTFSPDTFSPDTFSPDTFSPDTFSPDTFSPDTFSPDTFSPDTFSPDTFSPDTFSPDTFSPDTFSPDTFSSAQTRSLIAVSAYEGTMGEGILVNTWNKSGDFYVRVRGRNGAFDSDNSFHLQVIQLSGDCAQVNPLLPATSIQPVSGNYSTLILTNPDKMEGTATEKVTLQTNLNALAAATSGRVVDVSLDNRVSAASLQAENLPGCVYAMNLEAYAIKAVVDEFRAVNPLEYIVLVGNDRAFPFFRYTDNSLLANETIYSPPVRDNTTSQASLKMGYILTQDTYGAALEISSKAQTMPVPDLAIGRLVETAADINTLLQAYFAGNGVIQPTNALVTGYDFLEDVANAISSELQVSLGGAVDDTLIMSSALSPEDPSAWTATDLRNALFSSHHDLVFLAGHFSANSTTAADFKTHMLASEIMAAPAGTFTNSLIYSAGCHSGYNIVNPHGVPNVTVEPDWAQAFTAQGATLIGGTGYQYGDTDFIEYSERLYLEFTRQLGYGNGPVVLGKALVEAKRTYLANTPVMRGIHEKSVLEATLFGLPMLQINMPVHTPKPVDTSVVGSTTDAATNPGAVLGLEYADVHLTPTLTEQSLTLDVISEVGGMPAQVTAVYLEGPDGVVVNPAEPVLPLDMVNVTAPQAGFVLRGVGWRGGAYTDLLDRLPLTGAATSDLRAPHPAFFSDVFYPVRPWNTNYFDALSNAGGATRLAWMPAQYRSASPGSLTGVLRRFDSMDFRLYYSDNITSYPTSDPNWPNIPALSAPPDISHISSSINLDGSVSFEVTVVGDPAAGIQEVWILYTGMSGSLYGSWQPLDLTQNTSDSRLWQDTLAIGTTPVADLRFVVLAANGVGLVTMMTNEGAYYRAGVEPGAPPAGQQAVTLTLDQPAVSGDYGGHAAFTAVLSSQGAPLAGVPVEFSLGGQSKIAVTGSDGRATASFFLHAQPGDYTLSASYEGSETYAPASASSPFEILQGTSQLVLEPATQQATYSVSPQFIATVTSAGLPLVGKPVALTVMNTSGVVVFANVVTTDYAGRARWLIPILPVGNYTLTAWFGLPVSPVPELDLSNPFYSGSTDTAVLGVVSFTFSGFISPVENPPVVNKVKAGSAVPIKFSLGGDYGLEIFAAGYPLAVNRICAVSISNLVDETVSAGTSSLTYDPLIDQYTYVWKTDKKWAGTCRTLVLRFIDGSEYYAYFQLTK